MHPDIKTYLADLPAIRKERLERIREAFLNAVESIEETMRYKMPTYQKGPNWAALGNQKHYISIYFCSPELIANIKHKHPQLSTGKGCVRIRDNQALPLDELVESFKKAMTFK